MEVLLALVVIVFSLLYLWLRHDVGHWRRLGIPHNKPAIIVGNMQEWPDKKHISQIFMEWYKQFKGSGPFAGFHFYFSKAILVLDVELVKNILVKDFNNFANRGVYHNERDDPLTGNLFFLEGEKWRQLRHKMTPTFTSGKMRHMFSTVVKVGEELAQVMNEKIAHDGNILEITDLLGRYTADVIGSCAFGLECNSLRDPTAEFCVMGKRFFTDPRHSDIVDAFIHNFPNAARKLRMRVINQDVHNFYMRIVKETIAQREQNNIKRNDFMDMLIELKNTESLKDDNGVEIGGLTVEEVAAQAFVFFIAGFETSSTTMGFALYELAQHQDIQANLRNEIKEVFDKHKNEFTYQCMKDMEYLHQVICETLRMHPVLPHVTRRSTTNYQTSNPKFCIEADRLIIIPSIAIHYDPEYYPEPEIFNPGRFTADEILKRPACTWLPFGEGPRNCIGLRFGKMQAAIGLALLLKYFKFSVAEETKIPYELVNDNFLLNAKNGIKLKIEKI
ncbi:probable cytochrome P450 6a17 [Teleopsis dalmanni]|uniref:probable cytochrome P450 6a17 n=1 Tax=Teleopsis dalmanni TaxID=139649 RepID=UPI0018CEC07A|nr:probable cytochrome P450 6a17 [Teleopsis dalmanni]